MYKEKLKEKNKLKKSASFVMMEFKCTAVAQLMVRQCQKKAFNRVKSDG